MDRRRTPRVPLSSATSSATATGCSILSRGTSGNIPPCRRLRQHGARRLALWEATGERDLSRSRHGVGQSARRAILGYRAGRLCLLDEVPMCPNRYARAPRSIPRRRRQRRHDRRSRRGSSTPPATGYYGERANTLIQAFAGDVGPNYLQMASYLNNFEFCSHLHADRRHRTAAAIARTQDLIKAVLGRSLPNRLLMVVPPGETLPPGHPARRQDHAERPAHGLCLRRQMCSPPVTSAAVLSQVRKLPDNSPFSRMSGRHA